MIPWWSALIFGCLLFVAFLYGIHWAVRAIDRFLRNQDLGVSRRDHA